MYAIETLKEANLKISFPAEVYGFHCPDSPLNYFSPLSSILHHMWHLDFLVRATPCNTLYSIKWWVEFSLNFLWSLEMKVVGKTHLYDLHPLSLCKVFIQWFHDTYLTQFSSLTENKICNKWTEPWLVYGICLLLKPQPKGIVRATQLSLNE